MDNKNNQELPNNMLIPLVLVLTVISLWAGSGFFLYQTEQPGTYGDMFGAINALFSGLAFAGVVYAILLQRKELSLQREELSLTRNEIARSAKAQELSEKALTKQAISFATASQISAIDALIDIYDKEANSYRGQSYSGTKAQEVIDRQKYLSDKKAALHNHLEDLYKEITEHK